MRHVAILKGHRKHVPQAGECPECLEHLDGATCSNGRNVKPRPKDFSVCVYCGAILRYGRGLLLAAATDDDLAELPPHQVEQLRQMSCQFREARRQMSQPGGPGAVAIGI